VQLSGAAAMTNTLSIGVLSRSFSNHKTLRAELSALYPRVTFNDSNRTLQGAELIEFLAPHDAAVVALERVDGALLAALPRLKIISKYGVGLDNVDLRAAARLGRLVGWQGGVNRRSVAELAISFMISALRGVIVSHAEIRAGVWRQYRGRQLSSATVGLIGFGHVGQEVAALLRGFGARVLAHDIRDVGAPAAALGVELCGLDELLASADVVSLHVPLTAQTTNMLDARRLAALRPGAVLVNTARGGLVDEDALAAALRDGRLAGACFDVFGSEPPFGAALLAAPGFLGTAHIGGSAEEAVLAMGRAAIAGIGQPADPLSFISEWTA
jgi:D-3-phosphoglycerate dehydrogenase